MVSPSDSSSRVATNASIRRAIIWRLAAVSAVVAVLCVAGVVTVEKSMVSELVIDRAVVGSRFFQTLTADLLDKPVVTSQKDEFERRVESMAKRGPADELGHFVYASVRTVSGETVVSRYNEADPRAGDIAAMAKSFGSLLTREKGDARYGITRLGSVRYVAVETPLRNPKGQVVAYNQGLFEVSGRTLAGFWRAVRHVVLMQLIVIVAVALVLYPIINRLMQNLAYAALDLLEANIGTLETLGSAIAKRDSDTDAHNYRVTLYATRLAEALGRNADEIRSLIKGALLHDVGKIGVRDNILLKPGRLNQEEFEEMKLHVPHGLDIVRKDSWLRDTIEVVGSHHEKFDGSGYPRKLSDSEIPLSARIFAVVDVFDALTSRRPYKEPLSYEDTVKILSDSGGSHFDPDVLKAFLGIAPGLYESVCGRSDGATQAELRSIVRGYFLGDVAVLAGGRR